MFRKTVGSMSFPVYLDVVVTERILSIASLKEVTSEEYAKCTNPDEDQVTDNKSLKFNGDFKLGELPPTTSGVYHNRLPYMRLTKPYIDGASLKPELEGRYFRVVSYSQLDLDDPSINTGEKADGAVWVCGVDYEGNMRPFYNAIAYETATKMHPLRSVRNLGTPSNLFIYQPFADTPFTECSITLKYNKSLGYSCNIDGWKDAGTDYNYLTDLETAFPVLSMVSGSSDISADAYEEITIRIDSDEGKDTTIFLEETGGYLPKRRVETTDGVATFKVGALGLSAGDSFKVKAGFKNFSGMLDIPFNVI